MFAFWCVFRRNGEGVRVFWDRLREPSFTSRWNPFATDFPFITFTYHPVRKISDVFTALTDVSRLSMHGSLQITHKTFSSLSRDVSRCGLFGVYFQQQCPGYRIYRLDWWLRIGSMRCFACFLKYPPVQVSVCTLQTWVQALHLQFHVIFFNLNVNIFQQELFL